MQWGFTYDRSIINEAAVVTGIPRPYLDGVADDDGHDDAVDCHRLTEDNTD